MFKVRDRVEEDHLVEADYFKADFSIAGGVEFWKGDKKVAFFDRPTSIVFVEEKKEDVLKY